jgi:putative DNA primase/helicase
VLRVCDHFALVAAAGELAHELGIVYWQPGAAIEAARQCFNDWFETRGGVEAGEVHAAISQVRLFIERHGDSRFEPANAPSQRPVNNCAGWYKGEGVHREWLIPPETWKAEVAGGLDPQFVARVLADRGMMAPRNDDGPTRVWKIRGKSQRGYVVKANILAGTDNE